MAVRFREEEKALILNKVNWKVIEKAYGDTEDWPGKQVELFGAMVEYGGETQMGIRVRIPKSPPAATKSQAIDDSIPFEKTETLGGALGEAETRRSFTSEGERKCGCIITISATTAWRNAPATSTS